MIRFPIARPARSACCRWAGIAGALLGAALVGLLGVAVGRSAQEQPAAPRKSGLPTDLERVPGDVALIVSIRVADLLNCQPIKMMRQQRAQQLAEAIKGLEKELGVAPAETERATVASNDFQSMRSLVFVTTIKPYDRAKILSTAFVKTEQRANQTYFVADETRAVSFLNDQSYVIGAVDTVRTYLDRPVAGGPLTAVLHLANQKHHMVAGLVVPSFGPGGQVPRRLEPFKDLLKARTAIGSVDLGEQSKADLSLSFADEAEAKRAEKPLRTALDLAKAGLAAARQQAGRRPGGRARITPLMKLADAALQSASVAQKGADLQIVLRMKTDGSAVVAALVGGVQTMRRAANQAGHAQTMNNLKQIALAMHNFHAKYGHLPPQAIFSKDGEPLLSWRVLLLPFLEVGGGNLYKQFHLDEAWDSPHNLQLLAQMPGVYTDPNVKNPEFATIYQVLVGPGASFEGTKGLSFAKDFPDGTSNTLLIVEAAKPVPWTKPQDLAYDPKKPLPKLGGHTPGGFTAAACDGAVVVLKRDIKEMLLRALITRNGGEMVDPGEFRQSIQ